MAWAFARPGGGRSFGFTGGHFHRNWANDDFRRLVVNAILWCAKEEVPEGGAKVRLDPADLNKNLDRKGKGEFKPILPPEKK
jgi:type 1 glutamine amidotransferase